MVLTKTLLREKINQKVPSKLKSFFYSDLYLAVVTLAFFVSWATKLPLIGFLTLSILGSVILITLDDLLPVLPIVASVTCMISTSNASDFLLPAISFAPLIASIIFHIVVYPPKPRVGKMVAPQLLVLVSLVIGGCTVISAADYAAGLPYVLYLCLLPIFAYFLFDSYYKKNQYVENTVYFAKALMWLGFLIAAEILVYYIQHPVPINRLGQGDWLDFGWGIDNNAATLLLLTAPACFFLSFNFSSDTERGANAVKRLGWIYVASGMLQYIALCFTFSRGGILAAVLTAPFVIGFTIKKSARKLNAVLPPVICFAGALAVYFAFFDKFNSMFEGLLGGGGAGWANRDKLYLEAIDCFLHNPVFGAGAGFFGVYFDPHAIRFYWFHSTFFQIIANAGLVGLAAFGYSYFVRFRILGKNIKRNAFSLFALLSLIGFELYSMIDTGTFIPFPQMTLVLLLTLFVERANAELQHERNNVLMTETYVAETICASEQTD